jgi:hypothetical protein
MKLLQHISRPQLFQDVRHVQQVSHFLGRLDSQGEPENCLIVLTKRHGELREAEEGVVDTESVSGGAHPRYARNTGSGEPLAIATRLVPPDQEVFHDPEYPSSVILTVLN